MKKSIIRISCFLFILAFCLVYTNSVFKFKYGDGIYGLTKFYELDDNTVDVLVLGSSHAFENFNTGTLWDEYGMAAYILGGSIQPMWNTYYYLKEALKTQKPELIVLEGFCTVFAEEYIDDSRIIKNNYGLRWSKDKIESMKVSSPRERWKEFFLEYTQYHTRYKEINSEDFLNNQGNPMYDDWKGFGCNMATNSLEQMNVDGIADRLPLYSKTEEYYRATIELALENNIPIIVVIAPYAGVKEYEQQTYNEASDIASEYGISFLNCNLLNEEIGIDWTTDGADIAHLNYRGNVKFSRYIGQYLKSRYEITDRKEDEKYISWQNHADYIREMIYNQELLESNDLSSIMQKLKNDNYWLFISTAGSCNTADIVISELFNSMGISPILKDGIGEKGIWFATSTGVVWDSSMDAGELFRRTDKHDFHLKSSVDEGDVYNKIIIDNNNYEKVTNGINIVVYDTLTEKVIDSIGIDTDNEYSIVR